MPAIRIGAPSAEPITVDEFKAWAKVDHNDDDTIIASLIRAARRACEEELRRTLIRTPWRLTIDRFTDWVSLPMPHLLDVQSVKFIDTDGVLQTLHPADYTIDTVSEPGGLVPAYGKTWPSTREVINAVVVEYAAGFGNLATDVPDDLRTWVLMQVGHFYKNREASTTNLSRTPYVDGLLDPYRIFEE